MTETTHSDSSRAADPSLANGHGDQQVHHGKTPAAWAGAMISLVAFFVGGIGLILGPIWPVFWVGVGMIVVALIVTRILQVMGLGAKPRRH